MLHEVILLLQGIRFVPSADNHLYPSSPAGTRRGSSMQNKAGIVSRVPVRLRANPLNVGRPMKPPVLNGSLDQRTLACATANS